MSALPANSELSLESTPLLGTVLAVQANFYQVQLDVAGGQASDDSVKFSDREQSHNPKSQIPNPKLLCTRRTRLKKIGQRVMVGDRVVVEEPDWEGGRGAIADVLPRKTQLDRPPVANAEQILLVFALADPPLDPYQLTRFLVKAETTELDIRLCLNKSDLVSDEELEEWRS